MTIMKAIRHLVFVILVIAASFTALVCLTGCQVDVSGSVGAKLFYPKKIGDTREGMYDGSGYIERHSAGGQSDVKSPFKPMGGAK